MLARAIEGRSKTIYIDVFIRQIVRVDVEHVKMDVIQSLRQPGHIHHIFQLRPPGITAPRILNIQGSAAGAHVDFVTADLTVELAVIRPTAKCDHRGCLGDKFLHQV